MQVSVGSIAGKESGMKTVLVIGWLSTVASLFSMVIGHLGVHEMSWVSAQISTYAATAPYDYFITSSMLLSAFSLIIIGVLVSNYHIVGTGFLAHFVPPLSGAAASGLILVAYFEETATTLNMLKQSGFWAIRIQSFHDAGLLIFFYSTVLLVMLLGVLVLTSNLKVGTKVLGGIVLAMGPASYFLMTTTWPKFIGLDGVTIGANQRSALFCLWLAVALVLAIVSTKAIQQFAENYD